MGKRKMESTGSARNESHTSTHSPDPNRVESCCLRRRVVQKDDGASVVVVVVVLPSRRPHGDGGT